MAYATLDYLPDLNISQRTGALSGSLTTYQANNIGVENALVLYRSDSSAEFQDIYKITLSQGAQYFISSSSYFDPGLVVLYDEDGNAIAVGSDGAYGSDTLGWFTAPYTGVYYIDASWSQGSASVNKGVSLIVFENLPMPGNSGNDYLVGTSLFGGLGNDSIVGTTGNDYLRGDEGDDVLNGSDGFDDLNGNMGNDTVSGGAGDDWVVGGKDNDYLKGEQGDDICYGNLGNDTCEGGAGNDLIRGGQGSDFLLGGSGNDWISGDRDNDTITGNDGADTFNFFAEAGFDVVTDFHYSEGDRVRLDPGSIFSVAQVGSDTVITVGPSALTLSNVQLSALPSDWIFVG